MIGVGTLRACSGTSIPSRLRQARWLIEKATSVQLLHHVDQLISPPRRRLQLQRTASLGSLQRRPRRRSKACNTQTAATVSTARQPSASAAATTGRESTRTGLCSPGVHWGDELPSDTTSKMSRRFPPGEPPDIRLAKPGAAPSQHGSTQVVSSTSPQHNRASSTTRHRSPNPHNRKPRLKRGKG